MNILGQLVKHHCVKTSHTNSLRMSIDFDKWPKKSQLRTTAQDVPSKLYDVLMSCGTRPVGHDCGYTVEWVSAMVARSNMIISSKNGTKFAHHKVNHSHERS
jgi:hypothetical protein